MPTQRRLVCVCALLISTLSGCEGLFKESTSTIKIFATHSGTPDETGFPEYGDAGSTRVFMNDMGWEVALGEVYVTTAEVRLIRCEEDDGTPIEMFWGTCPEDFVRYDDRETLPLGAVTIADGSYCGVEVVYGPYVEDGDDDEHTNPENQAVIGKTVLLAGVARREIGDGMLEEIDFSVETDASVIATVDISELVDGEPVRIDDENFARNLTVLKTYDQFFAGIDFASATEAEIEAAVLASLEFDTHVFDGATVN
jgi:hypothetical protein